MYWAGDEWREEKTMCCLIEDVSWNISPPKLTNLRAVQMFLTVPSELRSFCDTPQKGDGQFREALSTNIRLHIHAIKRAQMPSNKHCITFEG